ncbi:hypothetical protein [Hymenobacter psychrotolerans]|uniref:Uncharacterized protein n=1 Tax=Hymenobacter psychrotolerans DSM 18569 TaxID=1121959 RepID=A0A1M7D0Y8_9BACT|nr:hypothetical protein [Hymenobacter psychrotolerans]SHL73181.1 hypothetical protein SAMN02746009_03267 [Hymenobacter psychrotolerans DSM 18569]
MKITRIVAPITRLILMAILGPEQLPTLGSQPAETGRRQRLAATTATQLLPLLKLLDTIQPQVASDSVFHLRRLKIQAHFAEVRREIRAERPRRQALQFALQALTELVREEVRDIHRDELQQAAREVVLATLTNAPALINVDNQARRLLV